MYMHLYNTSTCTCARKSMDMCIVNKHRCIHRASVSVLSNCQIKFLYHASTHVCNIYMYKKINVHVLYMYICMYTYMYIVVV